MQSKYHRGPVQTTPFFSRSTRMPSMRRVKVFGLLVFLFVISLLLWTASLRQQGSEDPVAAGDFYAKTKSALEKEPNLGSSTVAAEGEQDAEAERVMTQQRLQEAAQAAKDKANAKAPKPDPPSSLVGVGSAAEGAERGVAGRKKFPAGEAQEPVVEETKEEKEVKAELNSILKKSPIIIFSKSYCPYSKRAKTILLEKYIIDPVPFVVELDLHPLGPQLQARLAELTGRKTVPNVLINGISIGGGDDVGLLDSNKELIQKIKELGGKKMVDVREKPVVVEADHGLR